MGRARGCRRGIARTNGRRSSIRQYVGRVLGRRTSGSAHTHDGRWQTRSRTAGQHPDLFLASTQHIVAAFPPVRTPPASGGTDVALRAKWRAAVEQSDASRQRHASAAPTRGTSGRQTAHRHQPSQYPRLSDKTLVSIHRERPFPALPKVSNPRDYPRTGANDWREGHAPSASRAASGSRWKRSWRYP